MIDLPGAGRGPKLGRRVELRWMGDWGQANFHRILSWLSQEVIDRTAAGTTVWIRNGCGGADAALAVAAREVDMAISTPAAFSRMAMRGVGPFEGKALPKLRALAVLPQDDRLIFGIDRGFAVTDIRRVVERKLPLRIAVGTQDGLNYIGLGAKVMLEASGLSRQVLESWGGQYVLYERPEQCLAGMARGEADAIVQEAIMMPWWADMVKARDLALLPWGAEALTEVEQRFGWQRATLRANYFPGQEQALMVLDFADFQLMVREDMPEDVAHLITWCLCNTSAVIERQFQAFPKDRTPLGYPLEPARMARTILPLHLGARRCYAEAGVLPGYAI